MALLDDLDAALEKPITKTKFMAAMQLLCENPGFKGDTGATGATGAQGPKGDKGDKGDTGDTGATGAQGVKGDKGDKGDTGDTGPAGADGSGVPAGGTEGQALVKASNDDGDVEWATPEGGGGDPLDAWPVGSVFLSVVSTSPATLLGGGTWSQIAEGQFLVGQDSSDSDFNSAEETGGEKEHTLTIDEMPAHTHTYEGHSTSNGSADFSGSSDTQTTEDTSSTGGGQPHNNLPPYFVVYMWKRTE